MQGIDTIIKELETVAGFQDSILSFLFGKMSDLNTQKTSTGDGNRAYPFLLVDQDQTNAITVRTSNNGMPNVKAYSMRLVFYDEYNQAEQVDTDLESKFEELEQIAHQFIAKVHRRSRERASDIMLNLEGYENDFSRFNGADGLVSVGFTIEMRLFSGSCEIGTFSDIAKPTNLQASPDGSSIVLTWVDNEDSETGFKVYRSTSYSSGYELLTTTAANAETYTDTTPVSDTIYYYKVTAITASSESEASNIAAMLVSSATCADGSVTLNGGATIASDVPSGGTKDISVHDSAGADVGSVSSGVVVVSDASVTLGDGGSSILTNIKAQGSGAITVSRGGTDITADSTTDGAGNIAVPENEDIIYARPQHCNQTVSYFAGDAANQKANLFGVGNKVGTIQSLDYSAANPIKTLLFNNIFGNKHRFTDNQGNDVYGNGAVNIRYDHLTGVIYDATEFHNDVRRAFNDAVNGPWAIAQSKSESINTLTYSDWYVAPWEYISLLIETNITTNAEMRIGNTVGFGGLLLTSSVSNDGSRVFFVSSSIATADQEDTPNNNPFSFLYMTFIESGT